MRMKPYAFHGILCLMLLTACEVRKSESDHVLENYTRVPYDQYIDNDAYYVPPNSYYRSQGVSGPDDLD